MRIRETFHFTCTRRLTRAELISKAKMLEKGWQIRQRLAEQKLKSSKQVVGTESEISEKEKDEILEEALDFLESLGAE